MNIWFAVGAVVALALIVVIVVGTHRPRSAEDELSQPKSQAARPVASGSLNQASLRDLLRSVHAERQTGRLQLTAGGRSCSLYFLFGTLFHAVSDTLTGEAALQVCLAWQDVQYTFDKRAQMPAEETIQRPIEQILLTS